jgi:hypothetical protein
VQARIIRLKAATAWIDKHTTRKSVLGVGEPSAKAGNLSALFVVVNAQADARRASRVMEIRGGDEARGLSNRKIVKISEFTVPEISTGHRNPF